jgi:tryptophan halogenase
VRDYALPESLQHKLALFAARGHVPYFKDGFFSRDSWLAVLFGQGLVPKHYDRLADFLPLDELDAKLRDLHARIARQVADMTTHEYVIEQYCGSVAPRLQVGT